MSELKKCPECKEVFKWDDDVVRIESNNEIYHAECLTIFPIKWFAIVKGEPLGLIDEEPDMAFSFMTEGEYIESGGVNE